MRRHLVSATAALTAATASFGVLADGALAKKAPAPTKHPTKKTQPHRSATHPAKAKASKLYTHGAFQVHHATVDVPGRTITVTGFVHPYVAHQKVTLTAKVGHKLIATKRLAIRPT